MIGSTLLHYTVDAHLGEGGMGTVYRARDTVLDRTVAIKVLAGGDDESTRRLLHEARAASAFSHPNSVTIHAVEQLDDRAFIVMEYVDGVPLDAAIPASGLPLDRVLDYGCEMADALASAHEQGIVHRDIKPRNVMVTGTGHVKVLDFGIARRTTLPTDATRAPALDRTLSAPGTAIGTPGYMAPEQITGQPAGPRSDVFALGAVLFQMVSGRAPFTGDSAWALVDATMHHDPPPLTTLAPATPPAVAQIVARCLEKDPAARFASGREVLAALEAVRRERAGAGARRTPYLRAAVAVLIAIVAVGAVLFWWARGRENRARWVRDVAIPEIGRLTSVGDPVAAYRLALQLRASAPDDPRVEAAWNHATQPLSLSSDPPGAAVALRSLSGTDEGWIPLGTTPLTTRVPFSQMRWRFQLEGYELVEIVPNPFPVDVQLVRSGTGPPGMVRVPAGAFEHDRDHTSVALPDYWIDTFEITNRQFKAFVDSGGYRTREYWVEPFVKDGRTLGWDEAMALFRDTTGRPGPSTWELGTFPDGQDEWPVSGVSWYEAAAYARFAGKSLPTVYHWYHASGAASIFSEVLSYSNFGGRGAVRTGASGSLGPFGTHDMPGNVKEWAWNASSEQRRFILGGAWYEPAYVFRDEDAQSPFERGAGFGFRCILQQSPVDDHLLAPVVTLAPDPADLKPVSDEVYDAYRRLYDYDPRALDSRVDERDDTSPHWTMERVSFRAAYGDDRVPVMLFLPRPAKPPYQMVVFFPGSDAVRARSSRGISLRWIEFLVRSGRGVAFPIYQQTYERRREPTGPNFLREVSIQRGHDIRRTIDYLESRAEVDASRIAFYGLSLGAQLGPVYLAIEPRFRTGVLLSGGFETWTIPPETDPVHFAPRVRQPVLMVNGREDFDLPYHTAQIPMFQALGTGASDKRHAVLSGGHIPPRPQEVFKEILDWLDRYLGPVGR